MDSFDGLVSRGMWVVAMYTAQSFRLVVRAYFFSWVSQNCRFDAIIDVIVCVVQREVALSEAASGRQLPEDDARRMDMVVHGLGDLYDGKPLFCDVIVVSPLTGRGIPRRRSDRDQGAVLQLEQRLQPHRMCIG